MAAVQLLANYFCLRILYSSCHAVSRRRDTIQQTMTVAIGSSDYFDFPSVFSIVDNECFCPFQVAAEDDG